MYSLESQNWAKSTLRQQIFPQKSEPVLTAPDSLPDSWHISSRAGRHEVKMLVANTVVYSFIQLPFL